MQKKEIVCRITLTSLDVAISRLGGDANRVNFNSPLMQETDEIGDDNEVHFFGIIKNNDAIVSSAVIVFREFLDDLNYILDEILELSEVIIDFDSLNIGTDTKEAIQEVAYMLINKHKVTVVF